MDFHVGSPAEAQRARMSPGGGAFAAVDPLGLAPLLLERRSARAVAELLAPLSSGGQHPALDWLLTKPISNIFSRTSLGRLPLPFLPCRPNSAGL